ncbi:type 2 lantibiotic biosynthesis protein LanM [Actinokineospora baliensis]|uniref:type 2 lanthipeptide synthetase LanM family protein n=1 Tax=Actinokineospora baliensis TaxID=547056 RepID=UPI001959558B|nr:type 2 lanthipeptide synthetase LanM family protein [Actinokineospora baliensis]MBM7774784.1 type 2 lantibiotic biosynthesis protein LanM [Actinokineospora baliensis]
MTSSWWAAGLNLRERLATAPGAVAGSTEHAAEALARWREAHGLAESGQFAVRLADAGITQAHLLALLAEQPAALAGRTDIPAWAQAVAAAVAAAPVAPVWEREAPEAFAVPLRPFLDAARTRLASARLPPSVDERRVLAGFTDALAAKLARLVARTAVLELHRAREAGRLTGDTPADRFADFLAHLGTTTGLRALFTEYPVLGRLLARTCDQAVQTTLELLDRFTADRRAIVTDLLGGTDPGPLTAIDSGAGDRHQGGRAVAMLRFASGATVVYKPRSVSLHAHFGELVTWLNARVPALGLRAAAAIARPGYGWVEFIAHRECADDAGVARFYRAQGALLALLYAVDGTDIHFENLVAHGDTPVLVDVETLFHPTLPLRALAGEDPAVAAFAASVHRVALLPHLVLGEHGALDISGLGGDKGGQYPIDGVAWEGAGTDRMRLVRRTAEFVGAANRPALNGTHADPAAFQTALLGGFRAGYDAIVAGRDELRRALDRFAGDEIRIVARATRSYSTVLDESTHPDVLRDGLDRDRLFDVLWAESAHDPVRARLVRHEQADLWAGDIPLFTGRADSRDVWTSTGTRLPDLLDGSGLVASVAKLARMGADDRRAQEWLINAALATRTARPDHEGREALASRAAPAADQRRLLAAACGIADHLVATAARDDRRANWLGLEAIEGEHWSVLPLGAGLADGYVGVALFLAQLGALTGIACYTDLAARALPALPPLIGALAETPELVEAVGPGGLRGFGGISYAVARLARLLDSTELAECLPVAVELVGRGDNGRAGFADGRAGAVAALLAVHAETGLARAAALAGGFADLLVDGIQDGSVAGGFADGSAGIGYALSRYAAIGGERYAVAGLAELRRAPGQDLDDPRGVNHAWCTGMAGTVLAHAASDDSGLVDRWVAALGDQGPLRDNSLCHGELGVLEALTALAHRGHEAAQVVQSRRAGQLLDALERHGPRCGTPAAVPAPGLLSGLAGIGIGLLRLGFPESVPPVLLLAPGN